MSIELGSIDMITHETQSDMRPSSASFSSRRRRLIQRMDLGLLHDRRVRRLWLAQLTSTVGDGLILAALPFAVHSLGGSDEELVAALAVQAMTMALLFLPAGVLGDRLARRAVVVAADLMRFVARGSFAVLLLLGEATVWQLLAVQALNGAGTALFQATMDGFVPEVFGDRDEGQLRRVNALCTFAVSLGMTAGPAVGGVVFVIGGATATFAADAFTFLLSALLIFRLATPFAAPRSTRATFSDLFDDALEGWQGFRSMSWYWRVSVAFAIVNTLVLAPYFVIGPHVAMEFLGGMSSWATILVALGLGQLIGALALLVWEPKRPLLMGVAGVGVWVLPLLLMAGFAPLALQVGSVVAAGCSFAVFSAVWATVKQSHTPADIRARLGSFDGLLSLGPVFAGYVLGGVLLGAIGFQASLIVMASVLVLTIAWVVTSKSVVEVTAHRGADGGFRSGRDRASAPVVALVGTAD